MTTPPSPSADKRLGIAWLVSGLWLLGFLAMAGAALASREEGIAAGLMRAALMAGVGAGLCLLLWRGISTTRWALPIRVSLLTVGVVAAVAAHTAIDLGSAALFRTVAGDHDPVVKIVYDTPWRGFVMRLIIASNMLLYAGLYAFFAMAAVALRSASEARDRDQLLAEARIATAGARLAALRHQLSPHFVFNALNALASLVETGRTAEAGQLIERLSDFLRSSLSGEDAAFVTLDEELASLQAYLDIETVRFGDRLHVRYDCPPELRQAQVPSFLLQPLVENAIKHAVGPALQPVTIRLSAQTDGKDLVLSVDDDGPGEGAEPAVKPRGAGVGLRNTRERLALVYGSRGTLDAARHGDGFLATARLPLTLAEARGTL